MRVYDRILYEDSYRKPVDFVYGDVSNSSVAASARDRELFVAALKRLSATHDRLPWRLLYGTDWMLNTLGGGHTSYFDSFDRLFEAEPELQQYRDAFLGGNAVRFLFLDAAGKANQSYDRLRRFYASEQKEMPAVLAEAVPEALPDELPEAARRAGGA